jgi:hypothetical protein
MIQVCDFANGPRRDRTCDPLIKSPFRGVHGPHPHPLRPRFFTLLLRRI